MKAVVIKYQRTVVGKLFKWLFILFNLLMAFWLFGYWSTISPMIGSGSEAAQAGAAIGSAIGTGLILAIWTPGVIILGIVVLLTRGNRIEYDLEEYKALSRSSIFNISKRDGYVALGMAAAAFVLYIMMTTK